MFRRSHVLLALSILLVSSVAIANAGESKLGTFKSSTGETFFALSMSADAGIRAPDKHDVVILFDTSASQTGLYRDDALAALETMLKSLGDNDRVKLLAVDLNAVPMTDGFVAPHSAAMQQALRKLERRAPLGSTDMIGALQQAAAGLSSEKGRANSVVYIGDGISRANAIESKEFAGLVGDLVSHKAAVSSFAIGPQRNVYLLATLANQTGGVLLVDTDKTTGQQGSYHGKSRSRCCAVAG